VAIRPQDIVFRAPTRRRAAPHILFLERARANTFRVDNLKLASRVGPGRAQTSPAERHKRVCLQYPTTAPRPNRHNDFGVVVSRRAASQWPFHIVREKAAIDKVCPVSNLEVTLKRHRSTWLNHAARCHLQLQGLVVTPTPLLWTVFSEVIK